jgi:hypothetical protein
LQTEKIEMSKENDNKNDKKVSDKLMQANDLKAWQDGSLVNTDAINKLTLKQLDQVASILEEVK